MNRSLSVFTALLCSVSFIPLAGAAPGAALTDWHVAPVLSSGKNTKPYCALATSYPSAGVIITHARNKQGSGTVSFDFKNAAFEAKQFYGVDISFDGAIQQFAAEARNDHTLMIELRNDHALYGALDSGKDVEITVQQGGPHVTVAGNSRAFFQLNYCVQALTDETAAPIVANTANTPSFGLQQPLDAYHAPVAKPTILPSRQFAQAANIQVDAPQASGNDADLSNMLNKARSASDMPKRQKLSSISSNDIVDPNQGAPVNNPARQSLLFDNPDAANGYVAPRISDIDAGTNNTNTSALNAAPKKVEPVKPVMAAAPKPVAPALPPTVRAEAKPVPAPVVSSGVAAKPSAPALPPPKDSLSDLDEPIVAKPVVKTGIISDSERTVLATDYLKGNTTPAPVVSKSAAAAMPAKPLATAKPVVADTAPAIKPADIAWDKPTVSSAALAPPDRVAVPAAPGLSAATANPVMPTTALPAPASALAANKRQALLLDNPSVAPVIPAAPALAATTPSAVPEPAPSLPVKTVLSDANASAPVQPVATKPAVALKVDDVMTKAAQPVKAPGKTVALAPAPALPPALIEQSGIDIPTRGPMKRANEVVSVDFPEDADGNGDITPHADAVKTNVTNAPLVTPDALLQKSASTILAAVNFKPPAALSAAPWETKSMTPKNGGTPYCILQSRFANQQSLFLSRAADGTATLGVDYGMDLLQTNRDYKTTVQVDNLFTEDFIGQARQPNLLVVQMGRKDSLFAAAAKGKALHVEMEGGASTFDLSGAHNQMSSFNSCLGAQGSELPSQAAETMFNAPEPVAANPAPKPAASTLTLTTTQVDTALSQANIPASARPTTDGYQWGSSLDVIHGQVTERRFLADKVDLLEAVMRDIDGQEQSCTSATFTSEVGAPEQSGSTESVVAETSCTAKDNQTVITASLYQRIGQIFRIWTQKGPDNAHDLLIRQRDRLATVLDKTSAVANNLNDKPRS